MERHRRIAGTAGYSGHHPDELAEMVDRLELDVIDVRLSPRSRASGWNRRRLAALLGARYRHLPAWGNLNYQNGGPIEIADPDAGLAAVETSARTPLLLCVCATYETCHRRVLAELLGERGWVVEELGWDDEPPAASQVQLTLPGGGPGGGGGEEG